MTRLLPNPKYLKELIKRVNRAHKKIIVTNYLVELDAKDWAGDDPVKRLSSALVRAKRRGVLVSCILEGSKLAQNYAFYNLLKSKGIDVWLDTSKTFIHQKAVLVDDKCLIIGSHNWTRGALTNSEELSVVTDDRQAIGDFLKGFKNISAQREEIRKKSEAAVVSVPAGLVGDVVRPLYRAHGWLAVNFYLILLKEDGGTVRDIVINEEKWGVELDFKPVSERDLSRNYRKYFYKQRIGRLLNMLKMHGLVQVDRGGGVVRRVQLKEGGAKFDIPDTFWRCSWHTRLGFAAKYFYLISIMETKDSPFYPWWSRSLSEISRRYKCDPKGIGAGAKELADYNILEIVKGIPRKLGQGYTQEAQYYRLNPFYDMKDFERQMSGLGKRFSTDTVKSSRKIAGIFWASYNPEIIKIIAELIKRHGRERITTAAKKISKLRASSTRRSLDYLIFLLPPSSRTLQNRYH